MTDQSGAFPSTLREAPWDALIAVVTGYVNDRPVPGGDSDRAVVLAAIERARAALERPRPAPPEPSWKDTARVVFDALCAAHHPTSCRKHADDSAVCTCGRDAAFNAWEVTAELQNEYELENE